MREPTCDHLPKPGVNSQCRVKSAAGSQRSASLIGRGAMTKFVCFAGLLWGAFVGRAGVADSEGAGSYAHATALTMLRDGNARFVGGKPNYPHQSAARRTELAEKGQKPFATVLSCSDSRVPVELLFDQGIGDLFVVRVAGNVADTDEIGTIEYGAEHLGAPLLVVLGHTKCGAVTAVTEGAKLPGSIPKLVDNIVKPAKQVKAVNPGKNAAEVLPQVIEANIWQSIEDLFAKSKIVHHLAKTGKLKVVGALYDLGTGEVSFLGSHPKEEALLKK